MIEMNGSSEKSFSAAMEKAVAAALKPGLKASFFEVIEQKGAIADGKISEFQVKIKIAVEEEKKQDAPASGHRCPTCHGAVGEAGHMCTPITQHDKTCDWCGALIPDERHLCDAKVKKLAYICNSCGRTAVSAEHLCNPVKIEKSE